MNGNAAYTIAIIGNGWVGNAMKQLFPNAYIYTRHEGSKEEVNKCKVVFICIPTPLKDSKLDTSAIEACISWLDSDLIVVRSTVNPGDCNHWTQTFKKRILMQPEYLGETLDHPMTGQTKFLVIGGISDFRRQLIELYQTVYNANITIHQVSALEAEIIKLTENRAIAFKVAQCQELYDVCEKAGVDYYTIRDAVYGDDPRFNLWWTFVYPEKRGFNSKCLPKDVYAWAAWAESLGYEPAITKAILERNKAWI